MGDVIRLTMDLRGKKQIKLTILENEPLARLAEQRLWQEDIPCVVRSLGVGPGGWGAATNLPHAIYVKASDEMSAREVLELAPAEIAEREDSSSHAPQRPSTVVIATLIILAAALLLGTVELFVNRLIR